MYDLLRGREFRIIPITVGKIKSCKAELTYNIDFQTWLWASVNIFLVRDDSGEVGLVDAGFRVRRGDEAKAKGGLQQLMRKLRMFKVEPERVASLILTHLHNDHVSIPELFKNARVYAQASELAHALNPLSTQERFYDPANLRKLDRMNLETVKGDRDIGNGVRIIHTPGHTPGSQTVLVETKKGTCAICGDTVPIFHNWFPSNNSYVTRTDALKIPPDVHSDLHAWFASASKIERAKFIIPGHEPRLTDGKPIP